VSSVVTHWSHIKKGGRRRANFAPERDKITGERAEVGPGHPKLREEKKGKGT